MTPKEITDKWKILTKKLALEFDSEQPDLQIVLFLIGVQELGKGKQKFSKRQKEELMHIAVCRLLSELGYYTLKGLDGQGWPIWKLNKKISNYSSMEQEYLLKSLAVLYFKDIFNEDNHI